MGAAQPRLWPAKFHRAAMMSCVTSICDRKIKPFPTSGSSTRWQGLPFRLRALQGRISDQIVSDATRIALNYRGAPPKNIVSRPAERRAPGIPCELVWAHREYHECCRGIPARA
jgi:hypothetical protein